MAATTRRSVKSLRCNSFCSTAIVDLPSRRRVHSISSSASPQLCSSDCCWNDDNKTAICCRCPPLPPSRRRHCPWWHNESQWKLGNCNWRRSIGIDPFSLSFSLSLSLLIFSTSRGRMNGFSFSVTSSKIPRVDSISSSSSSSSSSTFYGNRSSPPSCFIDWPRSTRNRKRKPRCN